ncbi:hypothetical protein BXY85_3374 [Roseivirga pacifica]|uniref:Uncharacterized protein n=1 Tax=Roseivirga pacifica TaxID=1267423 RepID=A0A1I0QN75_9BACT|nr:hypothetical protein [Roseivirga pacifica]RKQ42763.1 hypothetical protein BXY85_3374 [Roseivirga pacifica]SEW28779.1 hypothetical protein SAMN05216290_2501 [Roseivirga pacifica]
MRRLFATLLVVLTLFNSLSFYFVTKFHNEQSAIEEYTNHKKEVYNIADYAADLSTSWSLYVYLLKEVPEMEDKVIQDHGRFIMAPQFPEVQVKIEKIIIEQNLKINTDDLMAAANNTVLQAQLYIATPTTTVPTANAEAPYLEHYAALDQSIGTDVNKLNTPPPRA